MNIDFKKNMGLVPVIVQDNITLQVLMLGYMTKEALDKTLKTGYVTFFSRSKQRLWTKGESSGNTLKLVDIKVDCDNDTILILASPKGPTCHTGATSCFDNDTSKGFLYKLEQIINDKINSDASNSYTNKLYRLGINKVAQKVGEEAIELIIEAKDNNDMLFKNEVADCLYHLLILLKMKNIKISEIEEVLHLRNCKHE